MPITNEHTLTNAVVASLNTASPVWVLGPNYRRLAYTTPTHWAEPAEVVFDVLALSTSPCGTSIDPAEADLREQLVRSLWTERTGVELPDQSRDPDRLARLRSRDVSDSTLASTWPRWESRTAHAWLAMNVLEVLRLAIECLGSSLSAARITSFDMLATQSRMTEGLAEVLDQTRTAAGICWSSYRQPDIRVRTFGFAEARLVPHGRFDAKVTRDLCARNALGAWRQKGRVTANNIEWLADLLWHLILFETAVPLTEVETTFAVNLRHAETGTDVYEHLRRARPLHLAYSHHEIATSADLKAWMSYLHAREGGTCVPIMGGTPPEPSGTTDAVPDRRLTGVIAASMGQARVRRYAMLSERSGLLERELRGLGLEPHPLIPVVLGDRSREIRWLFGSGAEDALTWQWLEDVSTSDEMQPVLIYLAGSAYHSLLHAATGDALSTDDVPSMVPSGGRREPKSTIVPLIPIGEERAVLAMVSLLRLWKLGPTRGSGKFLPVMMEDAGHLDWPRRDWMFIGEDFNEWVHRVHLFVHSSTGPDGLFSGSPSTNDSKMLLSNEFRWPESMLLDDLGVTYGRADLSQVIAAILGSDYEEGI